MTSRTGERRDQPTDLRVVMLEQDADAADRKVIEVRSEVTMLETRLNRMIGILVGILVSTTTASILLAINLVIPR